MRSKHILAALVAFIVAIIISQLVRVQYAQTPIQSDMSITNRQIIQTASQETQPEGVSDSPASATAAASSGGYPTARTLRESVTIAPLIVIGNVLNAGEIVNTTRQSIDHTQPDEYMFGIGQVYNFQVQRYLKGSGPTTIKVIQYEGWVDTVHEPATPARIQQAKAEFPFVPFDPGSQHLLFLRPSLGLESQGYWSGTFFPWRYTLAPDRGAVAEVLPDVILPADFAPVAASTFIEQVEQLVQAQANNPVTSLADQTAQSSVITIGTVRELGGRVNLARDPADPGQTATDTFQIGQVYVFDVQRYIKGSGPQTLNIVQQEGFIDAAPASVEPRDVEQAILLYRHIPLTPGASYVLFLNPLDGFADDNSYFTGKGEPWRFILPTNGSAAPESSAQLSPDFAARSSTQLIQQIEQLVQNSGGATIAPVAPQTATTVEPSLTAYPAAAGTPAPVAVYGSYDTARTLEEVTAQSEIIVIGNITTVGDTFNSRLDTQDSSKPARDSFGVGQEYELQVQQYLKGSGPDRLTIIQNEGAILSPPELVTQADIERAKAASGARPMLVGASYLLFMNQITAYPGKVYYGGSIEPWRFALAPDGTTTIETPSEALRTIPPDLLPSPEVPLLPHIEQLIRAERANTSGQTRTTTESAPGVTAADEPATAYPTP
jgi:hypothetical protein